MTRAPRHTGLLTAILLLLTGAGIAVAAPPSGAVQQPGSAGKALTAREVFTQLQCPALEILRKSSRLDMLDYWDADSIAPVKNGLEGVSNLIEVADDYLKVQLTPVSTLQIKLLPGKGGPMAMTLHTVGDDTQALDTQVAFYDADLQPIDGTRLLNAPGLKDFLQIPKGSAVKAKDAERLIPFATVCYNAAPGTDNLTAVLTVSQFMSRGDWETCKPLVKPLLTGVWNGKFSWR